MRELGITYTRAERKAIQQRLALKADYERRLRALLIGER